jgi:hypothetical protein
MLVPSHPNYQLRMYPQDKGCTMPLLLPRIYQQHTSDMSILILLP